LKPGQDASTPAEKSFKKRIGATSPPQSVANSSDDQIDIPRMSASALPRAGSPIPEAGHILDSEESEMITNPSIIQGPIGGVSHENKSHWPYGPTSPRPGENVIPPQSRHDELRGSKGALVDGADTAVGATTGAEVQPDITKTYYTPAYDSHEMGQTKELYTVGRIGVTSPGAKDEGYISAANARSPTPEPRNKALEALDKDDPGPFSSPPGPGDPFAETHNRHLSGYSHGMPSPLYDSATGRGIDRIQSKDIVALMDHVRLPNLLSF
jgi:hypothetical protein